MKEERLTLDSELLKPLKEKLEYEINLLTKNAIVTGRDGEILLSIDISVKPKRNKYLEPTFNSMISAKIKEEADLSTTSTGENYSVEIADDENVIIKKED